MILEEPPIIFFRHWNWGAAKDLAQAAKAGLLVSGLIKVNSPSQN
jgi:hypothetical protein